MTVDVGCESDCKVTLHPDLPETLCTLKTFGDKTPIYSFYIRN